MGLSVNTNVSSLNAQNRLRKSTNSLSKSFERLSSGMRINGAKDDAAGLAISNRMTAQVRGLNQAVRNANDGISMVQTAEGAMDESNQILQRIRELSVQSANDSNTDADRANLQDEVTQLVSELDRIAENTTYNGSKLLDGSFLGKKIQLGANANQTLDIGVADTRAKALGRQALNTGNTVNSTTAIGANDVVINGTSVRATQAADDTVSTTQNASSAIAKAAAINDVSGFTGVTATANAAVDSGNAAITAGTLNSTNYVAINGEAITGFDVLADDANGSLIDAINAKSENTGVIASLDAEGDMVLTADDGRNINVEAFGTGGTITGLAAGVTSGTVTLQSTSDVQLDVTAAGSNAIGFGSGAGTILQGVNANNGADSIDISTRAGANTAIGIIDVAIDQLSDSRSKLGAVQNRLDSSINNMSTTVENLSASRSRIQDADFATETAQLTKNQILQQASTSILAQANQGPNIALNLLG